MPVTQLGKFPFAGPAGKLEIPKVGTRLFGGVWAPETLPELMHVLVDAVGRKENIGGWRGQSLLDWRIDSGALRRVHQFRQKDDLDDMSDEGSREGFELPSDLALLDPIHEEAASQLLETSVVEYEEGLIDEARLIGHGYLGGRELSDLELLAVLQHHGAATRLLDLSRNVFVALYFACAVHPNDYGLLVGFDTEITSRVATQEELQKPIRQLLLESSGYSLTWSPRHLFERMRVQQSFFIFSQISWSRWGTLALRGPEDEDADQGDLTLIAVPPALKADRSRRQMHGLFGYEGKSLFPDLEGFSRYSASTVDFENF